MITNFAAEIRRRLVEMVAREDADSSSRETRDFADLGMARLEEEWENPEDAIYDNWKPLYGL